MARSLRRRGAEAGLKETELFACTGLVALMGIVGAMLRIDWESAAGRALMLLTVAAIFGAALGLR